jgi:hypothetical protein
VLPTPAPTRDQLQSILDARRGELREIPYRHLLLALAMDGRGAVLRLTRNQLQKEVIFDDGAAVDCHSNIATESLGRFLVSTGKISEHDAHDALNASASRGVPLEDILTEKRLIAPSELYRILQQNLGRKLLEPFSWTSGTWEISFDAPQLTSSLRVRIPQLIVTGVAKVEPQENADAAVAVAEGRRLVPGTDPLINADELRLGAEQQKVLDAARNGTLFAEYRTAAGAGADDANRTLCALMLLGVVATADPAAPFTRRAPVVEPSAQLIAPTPVDELPPLMAPSFAPTPQQRPPVVMPPFFDAPKASAPAPADFTPQVAMITAAPSEEVIATYLAFRRKDAFELLDIPETAGGVDISRAFVRMADRFLPTRFEERTPDGLRDKAQEIFLAAARAYAELADPSRRQALINERAVKRENAAAAKEALDSTAARKQQTGYKRTIIDPEALWKEGRQLMASGKLREALSNFEIAAECDAQNGTYAAEVAYCRFQLMISPASTALKALKNAIRIDPRSGIAYLYAGKVMQTMGNELEGQGYLDRAAKLMKR